ncbi:hypothetical protein EV580_5466 [Mycobacterium sp. BK086]|uniref:hypothetical protein n=1 Tax=Mycobacterium sp. BK086 TaxID=2512165 RepID=UPI00105D0760|nr:hypothetical protein [Mycobacterium sp. BK086]TDO07897.1 hypothetical protein EV580_5466 [Mycobacterium sp. BK086]
MIFFRNALRTILSAILLALPTLLAGPATGPAGAAPDQPADPAVTALPLPWTALGLNPSLVLGPNANMGVTVPVPAGLTAARVQGSIEVPMNVSPGYVEVDGGDGTFLGAVYVPAAGPDRLVTPFDIDISAARRGPSSVDLSFAFHPIERADEVCATQQLTLNNLVTVFAGVEPAVTSVASFFPSVVKRFTIYAPTDADTAEKQAVLTLVSTLARLYQPQPLAISVLTQPRGAIPPPAPSMERAIVVEAGPVGYTVVNPSSPAAYLRISGRGDSLTAQISLLVTQMQSLVQSPTARVDQAGATETRGGDTLTFSQLKMAGKTDVLRTGTMSVGVDRSALSAGRIDSVQVHLLADYTPVAKDDRGAVVIRSKGVVVYRALLDGSGRLDTTFDLERPDFGQGINLDFTLTYTPVQVCGPLLAPLTFQVDPRSTLTIHRGGPPLDGFTALPSEFSPGFMVALDGSGPNQLSYAAQIVAEIASLTSRQLTPQVVDVKTAADAATGALIVANAMAIRQTSLNPPVGGDGAGVTVRLPSELGLNVDGGIGSIQAFADRPRNRAVVLVTTTTGWNLVDPLFSYLAGLKNGWAELTGDVLAAGADGVPTNVAVRAEADTFQPAPPHKTSPLVFVGIGVGVLAAIAIVAATLRSGRRRNAAAASQAPSDPGA